MANLQKTFHLSANRLAHIAPLSAEDKRRVLSAKTGKGYPYYAGVKANLSGIFNVIGGLDLGLRRPTVKELATAVARCCTDPSDDSEVENNMAVANALRAFAIAHDVRAMTRSFSPLPLPPHCVVSYWEDLVLQFGGKNYVFLLDPSRDDGFNSESRRFIFSIQNAHIRQMPDMSETHFIVFQFGIDRNGALEAIPHFDTEADCFSIQQIETMVDETHRIGSEILIARRKKAA